jgi:hypothetical protein
MARRRIRKRFVLVLLTAALLAGMLAATGWTWQVEWPQSDDHSADFYDHREIGCWGDHFWMCWIDVPIPYARTTGADPPTQMNGLEFTPSVIFDAECQDAEEGALQAIQATTAGFRRPACGGLVLGSRLWLVRTVLGGLLVLTLWGAWRMRPRWPVTHCQKCGYDRAGLAVGAICPECGAAAAAR